MLEFNNIFESISGDPIKVGEIMLLLGLNTFDFQDYSKFGKIQEVISYLAKHPDPKYMIDKLTRGKPVDQLEHIWSYIQVEKDKRDHEGKLDSIKKEYEVQKEKGEADAEMEKEIERLESTLENKQEEMKIYEK